MRSPCAATGVLSQLERACAQQQRPSTTKTGNYCYVNRAGRKECVQESLYVDLQKPPNDLGTVLSPFESYSQQGGWAYLKIVDRRAIVHTPHILHQEVQGGSSFPCYVQGEHRFSFKDSLGDLWVQYQVRINQGGRVSRGSLLSQFHTHFPTLKCQQTWDRNALMAPLPKSSARCPGSRNHCVLHRRSARLSWEGLRLVSLALGYFPVCLFRFLKFCIYYYLKRYSFIFNFWPCLRVHKILVPQAGNKPALLAVESQF